MLWGSRRHRRVEQPQTDPRPDRRPRNRALPLGYGAIRRGGSSSLREPAPVARAVLGLALRVERHAPGADAAPLLGVAEPAMVRGAEAAGGVTEIAVVIGQPLRVR